MSPNLSKLTEAGQKEYSKILKDIKYHKGVIEKAEKYASESPTDTVRRAREGVLYHQRQVEAHEGVVQARINKIIEEGRRDEETKRNYLREAEEKLDRLLAQKSRQQIASETELDKLQKALERLESTVSECTISKLSDETFQEFRAEFLETEEEALARSRAARGQSGPVTDFFANNTFIYVPKTELGANGKRLPKKVMSA
jgi:hypothetical protein